MNPTKEQLADPKWWDKNAPEGAKYYGVIRGIPAFASDEWYEYDRGERYDFDDLDQVAHSRERLDIYAKRPATKKWRGPEDGLPPVGAECFLKINYRNSPQYVKDNLELLGINSSGDSRWNRVCIKFIGDKYVVVDASGHECLVPISCAVLMPLKSKEDLEREKEIDAMWGIHWAAPTAKDGIASIYDHGYRHRDTFAAREAELLQALNDLAKAYRKYGLEVAHDPQLKKAEALLNAASN